MRTRMITTLAGLVSLLGARSDAVFAGEVFTVGGFTWDDGNSITDARVFLGSYDPGNPGNLTSDIVVFGSGFVPRSATSALFDPTKTTGVVLAPSWLSGTTPGTITVGTNERRAGLELTWGGDVLPNAAGTDFVVYENGYNGSPEGFMVTVRKEGSGSFSSWRYAFSTAYDSNNVLVFVTGFDLDDFGIGVSESINAIRIQNVLPTDTVDDSSGQGNVILGGGSGWTILTGPEGDGGQYALSLLDPDITYVGVLNDLVTSKVPIAIAPVVMAVLFVVAGGVILKWQKRTRAARGNLS